jgi:alanyl-tRNA synthetase
LVDLAKFIQDDSVKPTSCVYMTDSYLQSLDMNVVKVSQEKRDVYLLLDSTIFHPKSGGQPSDVGVIDGAGYRVQVKRAMLQAGSIIHFGKAEGQVTTGPAKCKIDWDNRFLLMRRHTAAHLLDHCLATSTRIRVETTDSWLGDDPFVGYGGSEPANLDLKKIQEFGNRFIQQDLKVKIETLDRADAERLIAGAPNLARLPKAEKLRIVTIQGQIPIPCGGTHVRTLKEIGALEIIRTEPAETGFRIHFQVK